MTIKVTLIIETVEKGGIASHDCSRTIKATMSSQPDLDREVALADYLADQTVHQLWQFPNVSSVQLAK